MLKNLLDVCGSAIAFYATGYAFAYGQKENSSSITTDDETSFIGSANFFLAGNNVDPAFFFFQFAFSATSTTIVAGTLAERCRMGAYLCFSLILSGFVYPVLAHNICTCLHDHIDVLCDIVEFVYR
jgi:ammonium transporter, Amt family